jgi:DNA-binding NtrC family response regulator
MRVQLAERIADIGVDPMTTTTPAVTEVQEYAPEVLAGENTAVLRLQIARIAPHFRTMLVTGEAGTGKEAVAREMVRRCGASQDRDSFSAIEIGAFARGQLPVRLTGAVYLAGLERLEPGLQEPLVEQLKVIQREMRVIVGCESDLRGMLSTGRLRPSLASRLGSVEIRVATLRERLDDFEALAAAMLDRVNPGAVFSMEAMEAMKRHRWPGNLAELWKLVCALARVRGEVAVRDLPAFAEAETAGEAETRLEQVMRRHVFEVLQRCSGNKLKAAELLGISRSTLYRMLEVAGESTGG